MLSVVEERFSSEVKDAYQRSNSKFESLVTVRPIDAGDSTFFNKSVQGGEAQEKAIFGEIPDIGGGVGRVKCELATYYAKAEIDEQDAARTTVDGKLIMTKNVMAAIERKKDRLVLTALSAATQSIAAGGTGMTKAKVEEIWETFSDNLVFENGETPIVMIGTKQFTELMNIDEFNDADKVGMENLPYLDTKSERGRLWYDMIFIKNPKLDVDGSNVRSCYAFVPSAVGMAVSTNVLKTVVEADNKKDTVYHWSKYKAGSVIIDDMGVIKVLCDETVAST